MLTQSDVLRFIRHHPDVFSPWVQKMTVEEMLRPKPSPQRVHAVNMDESVMDAFRIMQLHRVTSLPVLDSHGDIVGNIRGVDAQFLVADVSSCLVPVSTFLKVSFVYSRF